MALSVASTPRRTDREGFWTGDLTFDGLLAADGDRFQLRGLLTASLRRQLGGWARQGTVRLRVRLGRGTLLLAAHSEATHQGDLFELLSLARTIESALRRPVTDRLREVALTDPEVRVRAAAADALLDAASDLETGELVEVLEDVARSSAVRPRHRYDAVWALARLEPTRARAVLGWPSLDGGDGAEERIELLGVLPGDWPNDTLSTLVVEGSRRGLESVWRSALAQLARRGPLELRPDLERWVVKTVGSPTGGPRWSEQKAAIALLGGLKRPSPAVIRVLRRQLANQNNPSAIREAAREALAKLAQRLPPAGSVSLRDAVPSEGWLAQVDEPDPSDDVSA